MISRNEYQNQVQRYMELLRSGVPAKDAFAQAFPNGVPTVEDAQKDAAKQQQKNAIAGIGGMAAGAIGSKAVYDAVTGQKILGGVGGKIANALGLGGTEAAAGATTEAAAGAAPTILSVEPVAGAATEAGAGAGAGAFSLSGIGSAGNAFLPAVGAFGAYDLLTHNRGAGRGALQGAASGAAIGSFFPGAGTAIGAGIGGALGLAKGLFGEHESTRDVARKHTSQLLNAGKDNSNWQNYVAGMRAQYNAPTRDSSKTYGNQFATFDEYKKAGLRADDLTGVYGNLKTFGPDWANYSQQQRQAVTQGLIDQGLYESKKGEVIVTDAEKAKQIRDSIIKSQQPGQKLMQSLRR